MPDETRATRTAGTCDGCGNPFPSNAPAGLCPACLMREGVHLVAASQAKPGAFVIPDTEELALLFPDFEIVDCLGHGGMGAVYKAVQKEIDRTVAIKILPPESATDPEFFERFRREAATLGRLDHPNIVKLFDFGQREHFTYFVMEFVDGVDLSQRISQGLASPREACDIVSQVCDALRHSHQQGFVHRDIKPANILIGEDGRVKVADFGLARLVQGNDPGLTRTHATLGTPRYMAPEQLANAPVIDHRADVYALGVVLYELLTGAVPMGHFEPPSAKVHSLTPRIDEVVLRTLSADPDKRYNDVNGLKAGLSDAVENPGPTHAARARVLTLRILGISAVAALLGAAAAYYVSDRKGARSLDSRARIANVNELVAASQMKLTLYADPTSPLLESDGRSVAGFAIAAARNEFALALRGDGKVQGWGNNRFGQIDPPPGLSSVVAIAAGQGLHSAHALALRADGTVTGWGDNTFQQLNSPKELSDAIAIAAGEFHSFALTRAGRVLAWGKAGAPISVPTGLPEVRSIAAGAQFIVALLATGEIVAWGQNSAGQCETPVVADAVEVAAGVHHALVRTEAGRVLAWGEHREGQCAVPANLPRVVRIFAGGNGSAALDEEGRLHSWGERPPGIREFRGEVGEVVIGSTTWGLLVPEE